MLLPNYQKVCSNLLGGLPERTKDVLIRRFGLSNGKERETLESIGEAYGITRERVRQIEEDGMARLKDPEVLRNAIPAFDYFQKHFGSQGGIKREDILLKDLGREKFNSCVLFLLTLGDPFLRYGETEDYYPFWTTNQDLAKISKELISRFVKNFKKESKPLPKTEFLQIQLKNLKNEFGKVINSEIIISSFEIAKRVEENPFGEIGLTDWPEISPRGIKDRAFLILKKEQKPLHFVEITDEINKLSLYPTKALPQTVHNELIKDPRFILVGRGIYALSEWGYKSGWVRDIIADILKEAKRPQSKEEIIEKVLKQRLVKENTILLNLTNKDYFIKTPNGKYTFKS